MTFQISHATSYNYESGVTFCHNIATLKPKDMLGQKLLDYRLEISPTPTDFSEKLDFFGNTVTRFSIQQHHKKLEVIAFSKIERDYSLQPNIYDSKKGISITLNEALVSLKKTDSELLDIRQFILESILVAKITPEIRAYAKISFKPNRSIFEAAYELMQRIYAEFEFNTEVTNVATPIHDVIKEKKGVCQDFAQIACQICEWLY